MRVGRSLLLLILCLGIAQVAHAEISLQLDSAEQDVDGFWVYDYSIHNTDTTAQVYSLFLDNLAPSLFWGVPPGWGDQSIIGQEVEAGFAQWNAPAQQDWVDFDIDKGELAGFSIRSEYRPGTVDWGLTVDGDANATTSDDVYELTGTVAGPSAGTPEPMSLCLLGMVAVPVLAWGRRRKGGSGKNTVDKA